MSDQARTSPRWGTEGRNLKAAAIIDTVAATSGRSPSGAWLDVGCGDGQIAALVATIVDSVVGIDPESWPEWRERAAGSSRLQFRTGEFDGPECPLPPNSFDGVICNQVYEHVRDPEGLVRNISLVLVPGGTCYFAGPNLFWPIEPHVFWPFVHWLPRHWAHSLMRRMGSKRYADLDAYSTHCFRLRRWFAKYGLEARSAIGARLAGDMRRRGWTTLATAIEGVPPAAFTAMEPMVPGFVFVLTKPGRSSTTGEPDAAAGRHGHE